MTTLGPNLDNIFGISNAFNPVTDSFLPNDNQLPEIIPDTSKIPATVASSLGGIHDLKCNQYIKENRTHIIYGGYEGIPENLLINFIGWIVSIYTQFFT